MGVVMHRIEIDCQTGAQSLVDLSKAEQDEFNKNSSLFAAQMQAEIDAASEQSRANAYRAESDPLFFKWQRGEIDKQVWLDKVAEIKARYA
jgi:hypothetical protein